MGTRCALTGLAMLTLSLSVGCTSAMPIMDVDAATDDTDMSATDTGPVTSDTGPVTSDTGPVASDTGPVASDTGPVASDTGPVASDTGPVQADTGPIGTDTGPAGTDTGPVEADTGPVGTDTGPVATDIGPAMDVPVVVDVGPVDVPPPCATGQTRCGGACVDLQTERTHCGSCGMVCATGLSCVAGACALVCPTGQSVCSGATCLDLQTDRRNCGACGMACEGGQVCAAGVCTAARACDDLLRRAPGTPSGSYIIDPDGSGGRDAFRVYCDMTTDGGGWTLVAAAVGETNMPRFDSPTIAPCVSASPSGPCFVGAANFTALALTEYRWSTETVAVGTRAPLENHREGVADVNATCVSSSEYFRLNQDSAAQGMGWTGCEPTEIFNATATCNTMFRPAWNLLACDGLPVAPGARTSPDFNCSPFGRYGSACNEFRNMRHWRRGQACPTGQVNCGGYCRATRYDLNHCGACGNVCGAGESCVAGACVGVTSCADLLRRQPGVPSGTYRIDPDGVGGAAGFPVYCDMVTDGGGWTLVAASVGETNMPRFTNNAVAPCVASNPHAPCFMGRAALAALTFRDHAWSTGPTAVDTRAPLENHREGAAAVNATCASATEYFRLNQDSAAQGMGWTGCEPTEVYNSTATCNTMFRPAWNLLVCDGLPISPGARTSPDFNCSPFGRYGSGCEGFRNLRHWRR